MATAIDVLAVMDEIRTALYGPLIEGKPGTDAPLDTAMVEARAAVAAMIAERDALREEVVALRQQPAAVVDDARMARALDAARCGLSPEHVAAIEEAIAAYDPNCGARTVRAQGVQS